MGEFAGQVALVTGSSSGIGEAIVRRLAELGASVIVNSVTSVGKGQQIAAEIGSNARYVQADISVKADCEALINATLDQFGRLDVLVNNAGWTSPVPHEDLEGLTDQIFNRTFSVNVMGTWMLTKLAMPHLKKSAQGNVITITSLGGLRPMGSSIAYSMTKAALNQMTLLLAKSCWPVRVNAVAPGVMDTPWLKRMPPRKGASMQPPLQRTGVPEDCAEATLALLRNRYVTGHIFVVDGGLSLVT